MVIFFLYSDCDDLPDEGVGGKWMDDVNPEIVDLSVNGSKRHQWKLCQSELEQVKAQGTMQRRYSIQKILLRATLRAVPPLPAASRGGIIGSSCCSWQPIAG